MKFKVTKSLNFVGVSATHKIRHKWYYNKHKSGSQEATSHITVKKAESAEATERDLFEIPGYAPFKNNNKARS